MASNYKLSNSAYSNQFDRENYDLTHDEVHKLRDAVENNYKAGGGFGYICIPKPKQAGEQTSNFDSQEHVECRPAFIPPSLVQRPGNDTSKQALNAKTFDQQQYYIFNTDMNADAAWIQGQGGNPDQTWKEFSGL